MPTADASFDAVEARFYVSEFTTTAYGPKGSGNVKLSAVSRGDQNRQWASATPSGTIEMVINNPPAAEWFRTHVGDDVALTFRLVPIYRPEDGHPFRESLAEPGTAYGPPNCGDCAFPEDRHTAA